MLKIIDTDKYGGITYAFPGGYVEVLEIRRILYIEYVCGQLTNTRRLIKSLLEYHPDIREIRATRVSGRNPNRKIRIRL